MNTNVQQATKDTWTTEAPPTPDDILEKWEAAQKALSDAKEIEATLRVLVIKSRPFPPEVKEGTQRVPLKNGWHLKAVLKQNYKLDQNAINEALDQIEALGEAEKVIAERLISWKADISIREYKELQDYPKIKKIIDSVLTITDGLPSLELEPPKASPRR